MIRYLLSRATCMVVLMAILCNCYYPCPDMNIYHFSDKETVLGQPGHKLYFPDDVGVLLNSSVPITDEDVLCVNKTYKAVNRIVRCTKHLPSVPQWNIDNKYQILSQDGYYMLLIMNPQKFLVKYTWWMYGNRTEVTQTSIINIGSTEHVLVEAELNTMVSIVNSYSRNAKDITLYNGTIALTGLWLSDVTIENCYLLEDNLRGKVSLTAKDGFYLLSVNVTCDLSGNYDIVTTITNENSERVRIIIKVQGSKHAVRLLISERPEAFGGTALLQCKHGTHGRLQWTLNGRKLDLDRYEGMYVEGPYDTLRIRNFQRELQGEYACIVEIDCYTLYSDSQFLAVEELEDALPSTTTDNISIQQSTERPIDNRDGSSVTLIIMIVIVILLLITVMFGLVVALYRYYGHRHSNYSRGRNSTRPEGVREVSLTHDTKEIEPLTIVDKPDGHNKMS